MVFLDEIDRLAPEGVGGVVDGAHPIGAAQNRVVRIAGGVQVGSVPKLAATCQR
jgi:hypothetical protein